MIRFAKNLWGIKKHLGGKTSKNREVIKVHHKNFGFCLKILGLPPFCIQNAKFSKQLKNGSKGNKKQQSCTQFLM